MTPLPVKGQPMPPIVSLKSAPDPAEILKVGRSGADFLADALIDAGVTRVFGVPGGPMLSLLEVTAKRSRLTFVLAKHEEGAVFMAEGHARATGEMGVACVTAGPGTTHALTAVASANSDGQPVLLIAGQIATGLFGRGALQDSSGGGGGLDTVDIFRSATKASLSVTEPQHFPLMLHRAIRTATTGRPGAVMLSMPANVLNAAAPTARPFYVAAQDARRAGPGEIQALIDALECAQHPLIFAGQGAKTTAPDGGLVALADRVGARVATTMKGKGAFPEDHPLAIGVFGNYGGSPSTHDSVLSSDVDLLLILGSSLGEVATFGWDPALVDGRDVWQVDTDPLQFGRALPIDHGIVADVTVLVHELVAGLSTPAQPRASPTRRRAISAAELQGDASTLKASAVAARLSELAQPETMLFVDNGNALCWIGEHFVARDNMRVFCSLNVGSMGYTVPAAIGAKLARPDVPVVAILGDASFAMTGMDLHTAAETGAAVLWIVLNNSGNAMVANLQELIYGTSTGALYAHRIDIAAVARGLGIEATPVTDLDGFDAAVATAIGSGRPWLLDVHVNPGEIPWPLRRRAQLLQDPR
ncbi:MAG: hypothetical protein JWP75_928 [Frondihabitans sp.]|nr:hypothetical protein [Frondihabitans sp.]